MCVSICACECAVVFSGRHESVNINRWMEVSEGHEGQVNCAAITVHTFYIPLF